MDPLDGTAEFTQGKCVCSSLSSFNVIWREIWRGPTMSLTTECTWHTIYATNSGYLSLYVVTSCREYKTSTIDSVKSSLTDFPCMFVRLYSTEDHTSHFSGLHLDLEEKNLPVIEAKFVLRP